MDTMSAIVALLKELGTPAITVIGFAWVIFKLNASKKDMSALDARLSTSIAALRTELKADISALDARLSTSIAELRTELKADMSALDARLSTSIAALDAKLSTSIAELRTELKADISGLEAKVSALAVDVKSIKGNHLPHIEAAIKELATGTPNEQHVKAILDLSREVELRTTDSEQ